MIAANHALLDAGFPERFHTIGIVGRNGVVGQAIIFLTPKQREVIMAKSLLHLPFADEEANPWSPEQTVEFIADMKMVGLLRHLDEQQLAELEQQLALDLLYDAVYVAVKIPGLVYVFDLECLYGSAAAVYTSLLNDISGLSKDEFKPVNIEVSVDNENDTESGRRIRLSFAFKGRTYRSDLNDSGDFVDPRFVCLANHALSDAGREGRFYGISVHSQYLYVVFLNVQQHQRIEKRQWFRLFDFAAEDA